MRSSRTVRGRQVATGLALAAGLAMAGATSASASSGATTDHGVPSKHGRQACSIAALGHGNDEVKVTADILHGRIRVDGEVVVVGRSHTCGKLPGPPGKGEGKGRKCVIVYKVGQPGGAPQKGASVVTGDMLHLVTAREVTGGAHRFVFAPSKGGDCPVPYHPGRTGGAGGSAGDGHSTGGK